MDDHGRTNERRDPALPAWQPTPTRHSRSFSPTRAGRTSRSATLATGRSRRASRTAGTSRSMRSRDASSRRRRGRRSTPRCRPSNSDRSSRRAARSSTPGRSRATWIRPTAHSNEFEIEWPPRSGKRRAIPGDRPGRVVRPDRGAPADQADAGAADRPARGGPRPLRPPRSARLGRRVPAARPEPSWRGAP